MWLIVLPSALWVGFCGCCGLLGSLWFIVGVFSFVYLLFGGDLVAYGLPLLQLFVAVVVCCGFGVVLLLFGCCWVARYRWLSF